MLTLSLDVGATKTHFGLLDGFKIIKDKIVPTLGHQGKNKVINNLITRIKDFCGQDFKKIKIINIAWAAQVDQQKGVVRLAPNFKDFKDVEIVKILRGKLRKPITLDNDAKCFALAESILGAGRNFNFVLGLTVGTGIGGALVIDKKVYRGKSNVAGEVGHMMIAPVWPKDRLLPVCGCGVKSHWEVVASGRVWQQLKKQYDKRRADQIVITNLARGLANLIVLFNPHMIVIGGGLMEHKGILNEIKKELKKYLPYDVLKSTPLVKPLLGNKAILLGAKLAGH